MEKGAIEGDQLEREKRYRDTDTEVDQKLKKMKEQLLIELRARDNTSLMLLASSPFVMRIQLETIPKKFMMPTLVAYDKACNLQDPVLNYKTFMELQMHSDALSCKVFPTTLTGQLKRGSTTWSQGA